MENEPNHRRELVEYAAVAMPMVCMAGFVIAKLIEKPELALPVLMVVAAGGTLTGIFGLSLMRHYLK